MGQRSRVSRPRLQNAGVQACGALGKACGVGLGVEAGECCPRPAGGPEGLGARGWGRREETGSAPTRRAPSGSSQPGPAVSPCGLGVLKNTTAADPVNLGTRGDEGHVEMRLFVWKGRKDRQCTCLVHKHVTQNFFRLCRKYKAEYFTADKRELE